MFLNPRRLGGEIYRFKKKKLKEQQIVGVVDEFLKIILLFFCHFNTPPQ